LEVLIEVNFAESPAAANPRGTNFPGTRHRAQRDRMDAEPFRRFLDVERPHG
jgi:hypothetical protein